VPGVVNLQYGYNGADNMTSLCRDEGDGSCLTKAVYADATCQTAPVPPVRGFCYDDVNRLLIATAPAAGQWGTLLYDYDWLGNRYFKSGYFDRAGDQTTTYVFDGKNRLDSTVGTETVPTMTFTWNKAGQLASSSDGAAYRYDGHGRRVLKSAPTGAVVYHHDPLGRVLAETLPDGTKLRDYIYLGNRLVAVDGCVEGDTPPCSGLHWYHTDTLGSVLARTGPGGQVEARMDYQPWGEEWASTGHVGSRQYNGRVYDPGTGFHDYGARLYWPQIGRFISADSVMGSPGSPMTLNRYSYVLNNPYKYTDPTGHSELAFNREQHVLVITGSIPGRVDSDPVVLGSFPAFNNTDSRSKGQWPEGTFARTHYNPHPESGADGAYGSNGIQVFSVNDANGRMPDRQVQRPGMGVHSGRENTPDGLGRKGPEAATMGCIRTTDAGSAAVNRVHAVDPVKTITVKNKVDRPAGSGYRDAGAAR